MKKKTISAFSNSKGIRLHLKHRKWSKIAENALKIKKIEKKQKKKAIIKSFVLNL